MDARLDHWGGLYRQLAELKGRHRAPSRPSARRIPVENAQVIAGPRAGLRVDSLRPTERCFSTQEAKRSSPQVRPVNAWLGTGATGLEPATSGVTGHLLGRDMEGRWAGSGADIACEARATAARPVARAVRCRTWPRAPPAARGRVVLPGGAASPRRRADRPRRRTRRSQPARSRRGPSPGHQR
jgi:hypothetical protein